MQDPDTDFPSSGVTMSASKFKTHCLALLDRVAETGVPIVVTKRGEPVAKLVPLGGGAQPPDLLGSVRYEHEEELLAPVSEEWDAER